MLVQTYLTRVRRRWINTIKMMTTSTPETTRISIVVSIDSLSLSFFLTTPGVYSSRFSTRFGPLDRNPDSSPPRLAGIKTGAVLLENYLIRYLRYPIELIRMITRVHQT